jgi:trans-2,3-dihydro-3-hydroxyanthranilate isomerase
MADEHTRAYRVVDVFTEQPLEGNALAVFPDGSGFDDLVMQRIARELNLSETVFVFPPENSEHAASLRIFTPTRELRFAGHPTVGTAFVLLDEGMVRANNGQFILEEKVGPVPVRVEAGDRPLIWLTTPEIEFGPTFDPVLCASSLGLQPNDLLAAAPQFVSAGNPTIFIGLRDKGTVDRAWLDVSGMKSLRGEYPTALCVFVFAPTPEGAYSRMFAPEYGIIEDPATGSSTGPLAAYMMRHKLVSGISGARFVSEQGTKMGRRSILHIRIRGEQGAESIEVGGYVTPLVSAVMRVSGLLKG